MKQVKLFEQFINETWKSGQDSVYMQGRDKILKLNYKQRFNKFILNASHGPFTRGHRDSINDLARKDVIIDIFRDHDHSSNETDALYYPIVDSKKLNEVKNWILACWDIISNDIIDSINKYEGDDLNLSSIGNNISEPSGAKKYAKHLDSSTYWQRSGTFTVLNSRIKELVEACYDISGDAKDMKLLCDMMRNELEKYIINYINGIIEIDASRQNHHAKFANEIGLIKGEHAPFRSMIPKDPNASKLENKYNITWKGQKPDYSDSSITNLPKAPGASDKIEQHRLHTKLSEKGNRMLKKLLNEYGGFSYIDHTHSDLYKPLEIYQFTFRRGSDDNEKWGRSTEYNGFVYGRVDLLNSEITLTDVDGKVWNSGKLSKINAQVIAKITTDVAPMETGHRINK